MKSTTQKTSSESNETSSSGLVLKPVTVGGRILKKTGKKVCCIYKITSPSGKIYIGQTINLYERIVIYRHTLAKYQYKLHHSLKKYSWEKHTIEIIQECLREELNDLEIHYIKLYNSFNTNEGMNLTAGGNQNVQISEETRQRMSESNRKRKRSPLSEEEKERLRGLRKGLSITEENKEKSKQRMLGNTYKANPWSDSRKENHSKKIKEARLKKDNNICQISLDGFLIAVYKTQTEASELTGVSIQLISNTINGRQPHAKRYIWK